MIDRFRAVVGGGALTVAALLGAVAPALPAAPASADIPPGGQLRLGFGGNQVLMMAGPFSGVRLMIYVDQWNGEVTVSRMVVPRQRDLVIVNRSGYLAWAEFRCPGKGPNSETIRDGTVARLPWTCEPSLGTGSLQS